MPDFSGIAGNARLTGNLKSRVKTGNTGHAFVFEGEAGLGKKTIARAFARALLCENPAGGDSCGLCKSCATFESGNNPDAIYISPEKTKSIGVDDIREKINAAVLLRPYLYGRKVYIIGEAHAMTAQAQNALLKTLEEAPAYCVFLLAADSEKPLLPTVLSRCVRYPVFPPAREEAVRVLSEKHGLPENAAGFYASMSSGNLGRALKLAGSESFAAMRRYVAGELLPGIGREKLTGLFRAAKKLEEYKDSFGDVLDVITLWYRDLLMYKRFNSDKYVIQKDLLEKIRAGAGAPEEAIFKSLEAAARTKARLAQNVNFQLAVEAMLLVLAGRGGEYV